MIPHFTFLKLMPALEMFIHWNCIAITLNKDSQFMVYFCNFSFFTSVFFNITFTTMTHLKTTPMTYKKRNCPSLVFFFASLLRYSFFHGARETFHIKLTKSPDAYNSTLQKLVSDNYEANVYQNDMRDHFWILYVWEAGFWHFVATVSLMMIKSLFKFLPLIYGTSDVSYIKQKDYFWRTSILFKACGKRFQVHTGVFQAFAKK